MVVSFAVSVSDHAYVVYLTTFLQLGGIVCILSSSDKVYIDTPFVDFDLAIEAIDMMATRTLVPGYDVG